MKNSIISISEIIQALSNRQSTRSIKKKLEFFPWKFDFENIPLTTVQTSIFIRKNSTIPQFYNILLLVEISIIDQQNSNKKNISPDQ